MTKERIDVEEDGSETIESEEETPEVKKEEIPSDLDAEDSGENKD